MQGALQHHHQQRYCWPSVLYTRRSGVTVICGHVTISMLWGNTAYCVKLSGGRRRYWTKLNLLV